MPYNRSETFSATTTFGDSWNVDPSIVPFNLHVSCTVTGAVTYKLQYTLDPCSVADGSATWIDSGDIPAGTTTSARAAFTSPVERIRIVFASNAGILKLQAIQGLSTN